MAHESSAGVLAHWSTLIENFNASPLELYALVEAAVERRNIPGAARSRVDYREGGALSARREYLRVARGKQVYDVCGAPYGTGFFVSSWHTEARARFGWLWLTGLVALVAGSLALAGLVLFLGVGSAADFYTAAVLAVLAVPMLGFVFPVLTFAIVGLVASRTDVGIGEALSVVPFLGPLYKQIFQPATYYKADTALMFQKSVHNAVLEALDELTADKGVRAIVESERRAALLPVFGLG
ncbi:MAG TPA: hypothetical protein VI306_09830 [Pyrinomonadaceae bacterium]